MNKLKEFLSYILENKKQVITLLVIGITILSIPVGLKLSQNQQTVKSRAAEETNITEAQCPDTIRTQRYFRPPTSNFTSACTSNGWVSLEAMKAYMRQVSWSGDYNNNLGVFDAYQGSISRPKNCVARVQEDWRKAGAAAPLDPWTDNKNLALGRGVHLGALDSNNPSLISGARLIISGPDGTHDLANNEMYTPTAAGRYTITAVGGPCNSPTATLNVIASCSDSCSSCIISQQGSGFLATFTDDPKWNPYSCTGYKPIVDQWCSNINRTDCNNMKAGVCKNECGGGAAPSSVPANIRVSCVSDTQATITWDGVSGASLYRTRLYDLQVNDGSKVCSGPNSCVDANTNSWTVGVVKDRQYKFWVHAANGMGDSGASENITFKCPGGIVTTPPSPPVVTPVTGGTVTCDANNRATFNWTAGSSTGKTVRSYVLRINKSPADWAPNDSGSDTTTVSQGDRAVWPINGTSVSVNLSSGSYLDYTVQTDFSDNTTLASANFGAFNCSGSVVSPTNGVCSATHYACSTGTSVNNSENSTNWTWTCNGSNGGTNATCSENKTQAQTGCSCSANNCLPDCQFTKLSGGAYSTPTKCSLSANVSTTVPTSDNKNSWCSRPKRTLGDADGNGSVDILDYAYYLRAALGGSVPVTVNPDFNGDGEVGQADLTIWKDGRGK